MSSKNNAHLMQKTKNQLNLNKNTSNEQNTLFKFFQNNSPISNKSLNNIHHSYNNNELKSGINSNIKTNTILGPLKGENDPEKQLLYYFKDKKIYIEIFNGNLNASQIFYNILLKYKIIQCKKLSKKIDYIVFKDGHLKTKKYAVLNNIKMVNPLWVDDKVNQHIFKDDKEYEIKTNFGDIVLREKYEKEKYNDNDDILGKNYELELEAEYDIEYANKIDKLRENNSQNNKYENDSIESTINSQNKDKFNNEIEKDITEKNMSLEDYRKKRKSSTNNKLENRSTINEKKNNSKNNENKAKKSMNSKENNKNGKKKVNKKNKKSKSTDNAHNDNNESIKDSYKNKKKDIDDGKNYILEFDQYDSKGLLLSTKKNNNNIQPISDKINIITYKLEDKEIQCLKSLSNFEYKGNLCNNEKDKNIYNNASIIIVEYKKVIYDWKIYEFLLDKKIIVDFTSFLLEFINGGDNSKKGFDMNIISEKINQISINNETYFFNKKKRTQKRSILHSLNIVDNIIMKDKKEIRQTSQQQDDIENKFFFIINQDIDDSEKKILNKLLKNFLKANIINNNMPKKRSRSFANQINLNLEKLTKKNKKNNLEVINEKETVNKDDSNRIEEDKDLKEIDNSININIKRIYNDNKENINYKNEGDNKIEEQKNDRTFFISKEKVNNIKFLKKVKYYKGIISYKYIYDSFLNGKLLDLDDPEIFNKYKLQ